MRARRMMMAAAGGAAQSVLPNAAFVASSGTTYTTSTTVAETIPAATEEGDLLLVWLMHRDEVTPPSGWTLVREQVRSVSTSTGEHNLSVYQRVAEIGDASTSPSWVQGSSQRMGVTILVFRGDVPLGVVGEAGRSGTAAPYDVAAVAATTDEQMGVVGITWNGDAGTITPPTGYTQTTPASVSQNRLGVAYSALGETEETEGAFGASPAAASDGQSHAQISVVLGAA